MSFPTCPGVSPITVRVGQGIKTTVSWTNTGGERYGFDVVVIMGDYDPSTNTIYNPYLIGLVLDQYVDAGRSTTTTTVSTAIPSGAARTDPYDLIVAICDWDTTTNQFIAVYAICLSPDIITVTS
jgi:hypothetical protein